MQNVRMISASLVGSVRAEWAHFARYKDNRIETTQRSSGRLLQGSTNSTLEVQEPGRFVIPSPALSQLSVISHTLASKNMTMHINTSLGEILQDGLLRRFNEVRAHALMIVICRPRPPVGEIFWLANAEKQSIFKKSL